MAWTQGVAAFVERFGEAVASVILTLVYFLVLGPFALVQRFLGDPLGQRRAAGASAWSDWPADRRDPAPGPAALARARRQG